MFQPACWRHFVNLNHILHIESFHISSSMCTIPFLRVLHTSPDLASCSCRVIQNVFWKYIYILACFSSYCRIYSQSSAVTTVTTVLWLPKKQGIFLFSEFSGWSAPSLLFNGFRGLVTVGEGVIRPKREPNHLSLSTTKIKNNRSYDSSPACAFMASTWTALHEHYHKRQYSPVQSFFVL